MNTSKLFDATNKNELLNQVEQRLLEIVKPLYARESDIPGLLDLPVAQLRALNLLGGAEQPWTPTMGELAEALGVALSTATQVVERLEKRGLARREHPATGDRRVVRLVLSEEGRSLLTARRTRRRERLAAALHSLSDEEQKAVVSALTPLAQAAIEADKRSHARIPHQEDLLSLISGT
jgi:DNA-binding MarR family transcriptional regulator